MATVRVSKRFTVNMGNYESYAPEFSVELGIDEFSVNRDLLKSSLQEAEKLVDEAAYNDLKEAADLSMIKDTYILTWLHNRKDKGYGANNKN